MISRMVVRLSLCALVIWTVPACGSGEDTQAGPDPCASATPVAVAADLPRSLPLEKWGTIVEFERRAGFIGAEAVTDTLIVELYPDIVRTLTGNGYTLLGGDNEGFEAEITFTGPTREHVGVTMREGPCADEVRIRVLIEENP